MRKSIYNIIIVTILLSASVAHASTETIDNPTTTPDTTTEITTTTLESTTTPETILEESISSTTVNFALRYYDQIIFQSPVKIFTTNTFSYQDNGENKIGTTGVTALGALTQADTLSENFSANKINYYSWGGYFLKCLNLASIGETCDNWQYTVNHTYPNVGADNYTVNDGDEVFFYFGQRFRIIIPTTTYALSNTTTATLEEYNFVDNTYLPATTGTLGLLHADDTTVVTTSINNVGEATFPLTATGTFRVGLLNISEYGDYYWPKSVDFNIIENVSTTTNDDQTNNGGNSGGTITNQTLTNSEISDAAQKILNFLRSKQTADGKIMDAGTSDWATIALAANNIYPDSVQNGGTSLFQYIYDTDPDNELNLCAAYPRHLLALRASGVAGSDSKITNLQNKILNECNRDDGYGVDNEINDDVFALTALLSVEGDLAFDNITKIITHILTKQQSDGGFLSYGYEGADITGAAINALKYAQTAGLEIDDSVFTRAKTYLKNTQLADGGWGWGISDPLNTSWALMGINALGEQQTDWSNASGKNPWHVLVSSLSTDGYYTSTWSEDGVEWFGEKHAVPALLGKYWPVVLPTKPNNNTGAGTTILITISSSSTIISTTTVATTTLVTTTGDITTDTPNAIMATDTPALTLSSTTTQTKIRTSSTVKHPKKHFATTNRTTTTRKDNLTNSPTDTKIIEQPNERPNNTADRQTAKKIFTLAGGGALSIGLYLGLKLFRTLI